MKTGQPIAPDDRSFLYGDGLFETVRVQESGVIRWLDDHIERLERSGRALGFETSLIERGVKLLKTLHTRTPGVWRLTVSRGGLDRDGHPVPFGGSGSVSLRFRPYMPIRRPRLTLAPGFYLPDDRFAEYKTTSFIRSIEARRHAQYNGFDDAIMVSREGLVGEASCANIIVVRAGRAFTPPIRGVLPGVTRHNLLKLSRQAGEPIEERSIDVQELEEAEELVLLSATHGLFSAQSFQERKLDEAWCERAWRWVEED